VILLAQNSADKAKNGSRPTDKAKNESKTTDKAKNDADSNQPARSRKTEKSPLDRSLHGRKCVGCGEFAGKKALIRAVRTKEGAVLIDPTGKANGRGAYLHASPACAAMAKKKRGLERALKTDSKSVEGIYNQIIQAYDD
jgi:predicted RNA-binding protein YlxR (DUF448 family)